MKAVRPDAETSIVETELKALMLAAQSGEKASYQLLLTKISGLLESFIKGSFRRLGLSWRG